MIRLLFKNITVLFVAVFLLLPACITRKRAVADLAIQKRAEVDLARRESEQNIRKGDLDGSLGVYGAALRKYPGDRRLLTYYLKTAEYIRKAADEAFDKEEFALSGRTYAVLLRNFPRFQEIAANLTFDSKYLKGRLKECSDRLAKLALTQYRQGNLTAALALWKSILAFDPENDNVKRSIDTTSSQLKNLRQRAE